MTSRMEAGFLIGILSPEEMMLGQCLNQQLVSGDPWEISGLLLREIMPDLFSLTLSWAVTT